MLFSNLVYLKGLLMVLTAVVGTVAGGTMLSSYVNGGKVGPSFLLTVNPSTLSIEQGSSLTSTVSIISVNSFSGTVSRSEEHTSELQSQFHLVCRLLLEKKKNRKGRF